MKLTKQDLIEIIKEELRDHASALAKSLDPDVPQPGWEELIRSPGPGYTGHGPYYEGEGVGWGENIPEYFHYPETAIARDIVAPRLKQDIQGLSADPATVTFKPIRQSIGGSSQVPASERARALAPEGGPVNPGWAPTGNQSDEYNYYLNLPLGYEFTVDPGAEDRGYAEAPGMTEFNQSRPRTKGEAGWRRWNVAAADGPAGFSVMMTPEERFMLDMAIQQRRANSKTTEFDP